MRQPALTWGAFSTATGACQYLEKQACLLKKFPLHLQPSLNQETFWLQRAKGILLSLFPQGGSAPSGSTSTSKPAVSGSTAKVESARSKDAAIAGKYKTTGNLYLRVGAGTGKTAITLMPKGSDVQCYGYYTSYNGTRWYYVAYGNLTGFCSSEYLKRA